MQMPVEDLSKKILSKQIDKQDAMRLFQSLDKESQQRVLAIVRRAEGIAPAPDGKGAARALQALDQRELGDEHRAWIAALVEKYDRFVPKSKANVLEHQLHFVDQRRAFHLIKDLKKLHFQITYTRAEGAYVHDVDGNRYIDISGDMGVNLFGHRAPFLIKAIKHSLDQGIPLVGYSDMIFRACQLFCEITGHERTLFTQSGTEAVMFAVRIARAATGRKKIVLFDGSYHGLSDAVAATRDLAGNSFPLAPGILQEFAEQIIVLDYGDMASLDVIEQCAAEIATVLVEPVQSRHPYKKPVEFLKALRQLTIEKDIPLIFDEMITGFRVGPQGAQGLFGIQADMATYGKIPGGGLPTGVIAGAAKYLDLVDGGSWQFDDDSMPSAKRTGMAGTHSQNPLKIAAALAVLGEIKKRSAETAPDGTVTCFQDVLNRKTTALADVLNTFFREECLPVVIDTFGSLFRFRFVDSYWGVTEALFFILLRMEGVETNIQGNCFLTTAHSDEDIAAVIAGVKASMSNLKRSGFFREPDQEPPTQDSAALPDTTAFAPSPSGRASPGKDIERLKALLNADLALAEELSLTDELGSLK
ncbi:aminotransferase class III-fold pyridoxal phosphate-dependent enzyme [Pseudomarimonas arenosa]|uniref:Aminotransferase class III-fold pyridoxal phosphate-dependent enzyme n=1 Tax=Pseudomarimonas arenosa TaxID=2774145 RepID=A0AAW3ZLY1_9GAMM|nr:aminotransferase class III-fold pyridoxal phosphate-dependent enzyme [Pseudomarimonas arenosa]MBD8525910.1 aminotransferase class III-fold pyridoxal phosphate-dependent enzyme [Pseudomarimonas arenosa]